MRDLNAIKSPLLLGVFLFLGIAFCSQPGWAAPPPKKIKIELKNGDQLTGELLSESAERVVIRTQWKQKVTIPTAEITKREFLEPPAPVAPAPAAAPPAAPAPAPAAAAPAPGSDTNAAPAKIEPPLMQQMTTWLRRNFFTNLTGKVDVGMNVTQGTRDSTLYFVNLTATHTAMTNRLRNVIHYRADYGRTEGVVSMNKMEGGLKTDFDIQKDKKVYVYHKGLAGYDEIQRVDLRYEVGPGLGYKLISKTNLLTKSDQLRVTTEVGGLYQRFNYSTGTVRENISMRFAEDLFWNFSEPKLTLQQKFEYIPKLDDTSDYRVRFQVDLTYPIFKRVTLTTTFIDEYTSKPISSAIEKNEMQIRTAVGFSF